MAEGRTLVGHGLSKDLKVLLLSHPRKNIRDTAKWVVVEGRGPAVACDAVGGGTKPRRR
jgi:hypothetical protein